MILKIDDNFISSVSEKAKASPRGRMNYNFHKVYDAKLQRLLNAMEPGTYIQPHKHENPDKFEIFFALRGRIVIVEFDEDGNITDHLILDSQNGNYGVEIPERTYHTLIALDEGSVAYEIKEGPFDPAAAKNFAPWAPSEGDPAVEDYLKGILKKLKIAE